MIPSLTYSIAKIEGESAAFWKAKQVWKTDDNQALPKRFILDMFPYPSGAGLHVGHLLGYFASDVFAIRARMEGYNVLHPMGFDAFGLPAEQYAITRGEHPAITTERNIKTYRELLQYSGLSFDWDREITTSHPAYYHWTQMLFLHFFKSWYNPLTKQAEKIKSLQDELAKHGNQRILHQGSAPPCSAAAWHMMDVAKKETLLSHYRLAYQRATMVNWCPDLGTVLAHDEVKEGRSERGGHLVVRKAMRQWHLRMLPYADALLEGLEQLDWPEPVKAIQRHWIGRSKGVEINFPLEKEGQPITIFTTRPETIFGVAYLAVAPEHPFVKTILAEKGLDNPTKPTHPSIEYNGKQNRQTAAPTNKSGIQQTLHLHIKAALQRTERKRLQDADIPHGCFTGHYARHPLSGNRIPIWVADALLPHYGSGAIMGVPAHDRGDHAFASYHNLPFNRVIAAKKGNALPYEGKEGKMVNADFLNDQTPQVAAKKITDYLIDQGIGKTKTCYRLRDPAFGRQRYWGEPIPIAYQREGVAISLSEDELPLTLPNLSSYAPTPEGAPPLARAQGWNNSKGDPLSQETMPSWAASSWYFFRYMDPQNKAAFASPEAMAYWQGVDLYVGGREHATGHLLYARFFTRFLHDLGLVPIKEPFQKLWNQGMIQATSYFVYRIKEKNQFVSHGLKAKYKTTPLHVKTSLVRKGKLDLKGFCQWRPDLANASFILEGQDYYCGSALEKMSKSKHNSVDPKAIIDRYGRDALRLHLLFLGPITQPKPWNSKGIEGVVRFLQKTWRLFQQEGGPKKPSKMTQQALHQATRSVEQAMKRYALNTAISSLMIAVKKLTALGPHSPVHLKDLVLLLAPFAPHLAEALWQQLNQKGSVVHNPFPNCQPAFLSKSTITYPIAINGKRRTQLELSNSLDRRELEIAALASPQLKKWLEGKKPKKVIVVLKRMINIVV